MQSVAAAVTMVRDDVFFLKAWLRHYGAALGRENCYIVNHGRGEAVAALAEGCNMIGIPGDPHPNFDMKRWRLLNNLNAALRCYYTHVIIGDVDELVVVDPAFGQTLLEFLGAASKKRFLTPLGLEVVHRVDLEDAAIEDHVLGPRRFVRLAPHYSKPCVVSNDGKISRGGHFSQGIKLHTPECLYLFHLKYCDFQTYAEVMNRRNAMTQAMGVGVQDAAIGRHWFAEARGEDRAVFEAFTREEVRPGFDFGWVRAAMHASWKLRNDKGLYQFDRPDYPGLYEVPERFFGVI